MITWVGMDILFFSGSLFIAVSNGLWFSRLLDHRVFRYRNLAAPILGHSAVSVFAFFAFYLNSPLLFTFLFLVFSGLLALFYSKKRGELSFLNRTQTYSLLGGLLFCVAVLLTPKWIGGHRFMSFQANPYDNLNYLEASIAYQYNSNSKLLQLTPGQIEVDPILGSARSGVTESRPGVDILFATLSAPLHRSMFRISYTYLVYLAIFLFFGSAFLSLNLSNLGLERGILIATAITGGFWGQFSIDLNAWSQLSSQGPALLSVALASRWMARNFGSKNVPQYFNLRAMLAWTLSLSGCAFLYGEITAFFAAVYIGFTLVACTLPRLCLRKKTLAPLGIPLGMGLCLLLVLPVFRPTLGYVSGMYRGAAFADWWNNFYSFLSGREGVFNLPIVWKGSNFLAGLLGVFFIGPGAHWAAWPKAIAHLLVLFFLIPILFRFITWVWQSFRKAP